MIWRGRQEDDVRTNSSLKIPSQVEDAVGYVDFVERRDLPKLGSIRANEIDHLLPFVAIPLLCFSNGEEVMLHQGTNSIFAFRTIDPAIKHVELPASIAREVLAGANGPRRDIVLINSAAALVAACRAANLREGMLLAADAIDSGRAAAKLEALASYTTGVEKTGAG